MGCHRKEMWVMHHACVCGGIYMCVYEGGGGMYAYGGMCVGRGVELMHWGNTDKRMLLTKIN